MRDDLHVHNDSRQHLVGLNSLNYNCRATDKARMLRHTLEDFTV